MGSNSGGNAARSSATTGAVRHITSCQGTCLDTGVWLQKLLQLESAMETITPTAWGRTSYVEDNMKGRKVHTSRPYPGGLCRRFANDVLHVPELHKPTIYAGD